MRTSLFLDLVADIAPDRVAVDSMQGRLTYGGMRQQALALAAVLRERDYRNLGFLGVNTPALPVALFGAGYAGMSFAPLNYRLTDERLRALAARLAPALVIADDAMSDRLAGIAGIDVLSRSALAELSAGPGTRQTEEDDTAHPAVLLFTSGTSGEPKAATLSHDNLTSYVLQTVEFFGAGEDEGALISVPPYHIAAVSSLLSSVYSGRRMIQIESFEPRLWVDSARQFAATQAMVVPTMLGRILDTLEADGQTIPSLRSLAYGGGRMPLPVIHRALRALPAVSFTNAYGLTETSSTIALLGPEDHALARAGDPQGLARLGSVGKPVPGIEVEVRDGDGRPVAPNTPGEVWVRGSQVSGRYVGRNDTDSEGWFPTRDRAWFDADGYLYLDGRLDDVIVRGGENISPGEIEDVLREHPAVADIAVIGIPDLEWGERIAAFVVLRDTAAAHEELREWVRVRLRSTRAPEDIHVRTALPYNETGKLLRRVLRDELIREV